MGSGTIVRTAIAIFLGLLLALPVRESCASDRISVTFYQNEKWRPPAVKPNPAAEQGNLDAFKAAFSAPVVVEADALDVHEPAKQAIFRGNVRVRKNGIVMRATVVTAIYAGDLAPTETRQQPPRRWPQLMNLKAEQRILVASMDGRTVAMAEGAIFDVKANVVVLVGRPSLSHDETITQGSWLTIDLTTGGYSYGFEPSQKGPQWQPRPYDNQDPPVGLPRRFSAGP